MESVIELYRDDYVITSFRVSYNRFELVQSEPASDVLAELDIRHRLQVANLFVNRAKERYPDKSGAELAPFSQEEAMPNDQQILHLARLAFADLGYDPFDEIRGYLKDNGLKMAGSTWAN